MQPLFKVIDTNKNNLDVTDDLERIALEEEWAQEFIYCGMQFWVINEYGELYLIDECRGCTYPPENYKVVFNKEYFTELENDTIY